MKKPVYPFLFLFIFFVISRNQNSESAAPNIIYILADDLDFGDLGTFNQEGKIKTPHPDQIAN